MQTNEALSLKRLGVLDIGSNSVRLVIYEFFGTHFSPVYNEKILAGLGRDLRKTGELSEEGKEMALDALKRFKTIAESQGLGDLLIGATAALRVASDAANFIRQVKAETGLDISPISGEQEAHLTAMGLIAAQPRAEGLAADLGGASLELIHVGKGKADKGISLPLGPFDVMGRNISDPSVFIDTQVMDSISQHLDGAELESFKGQTLYLIGGAWRNLAAVHQARTDYSMRTLQAYEMPPGEALELAQWAYGEGRETLLNWRGLRRRRAETLPYSGFLLEQLLQRLSPKRIVISTTGLREGLVYEALPETLKARDALLDGCRDLARGNLQAIHFGDPLYNFLKEAAVHFPHHFEPDNENRLRLAACYLAGIGKGLHPDYRADLVFDNVLYAPVAGLTHHERAYLALMLYSSYTGKSLPKNGAAVMALLSEEAQKSARIYGTAMRLAVVATARSADLLDVFTLSVKDGAISFDVVTDKGSLLSDRVKYRLNKLSQISGLPLV